MPTASPPTKRAVSDNTDDRAERAQLDDSGLFDAAWYLVSYPDVRDDELDPLVNFCRVGWREGRRPTSISIRNGTSSAIRTCAQRG